MQAVSRILYGIMQISERQTYCIASAILLNAARFPAWHDSQTPIVQGLPLTYLHA